MPLAFCLLAVLAVAQDPADHSANPVFQELIEQGLAINGSTVRLPAPTLPDGKDADASLAILKRVAGDDRAAREMLRDSVTAPFILKTRDVKAGDAIVRVADLWFVVHASLDEIDPSRAVRQANDQAVEAGNMRFESKVLDEKDLRDRKVQPLPPAEGRQEWYTHLSGRLLDRIQADATDRAVATRSPDSLVIAARTESAFDADAHYPNQWATLTRQGNAETPGPAHRYVGGASYVKITRLANEPGALFVEGHFAFNEPHEWFQGNPILRSKISVIAQDQIRRLRRELEKNRSKK